jgi:CBS domain-containing protein
MISSTANPQYTKASRPDSYAFKLFILDRKPANSLVVLIQVTRPQEPPRRAPSHCKGLVQDGFDVYRATARDVMTPGIHCCREEDDLAKAVRHMETLEVRRLPVINKSKRMVGTLALGDFSNVAPSELLSEYVKGVSAHH